jgi:hypothetical protein
MSAVLFHDVYAMVHQPRLVKRIYFMYRRQTVTMLRKATDRYATPRAVRAYKRPGITKYALDTILIDALNESMIVPHLGNRTGYTYAQLGNLPPHLRFRYRDNARNARQAVTGNFVPPDDGSADDDGSDDISADGSADSGISLTHTPSHSSGEFTYYYDSDGNEIFPGNNAVDPLRE